jgi:hypothetical protein
MPAAGEDEKEAARVFLCGGYAGYAEVGDGVSEDEEFGTKLDSSDHTMRA